MGTRLRLQRTFMHKLDTKRNSDRYSAVNTLNRETLEMRIFRGSVNGDTIKSQLDLAHASVEYTRNLTVQDVTLNGALTSDNFMWYIFEHEDLYPELVARIDKLITPDLPVRLAEHFVATYNKCVRITYHYDECLNVSLVVASPNSTPRKKDLECASCNNPHGFGFAVITPNGIVTGRGMSSKKVIKQFLEVRKQYPESYAMFHARYATHGVKNEDNCHPFKVPSESRYISSTQWYP
jgi:hypothetical protein